MTGLQRRVAESEARKRLRNDIESPRRNSFARETSEDIVNEAVEAFERKLEKVSKGQKLLDGRA